MRTSHSRSAAAPLARVARERAEAVGAAARISISVQKNASSIALERVGERERRRAPELERRRVERGEHEVAVVERDARHLARALCARLRSSGSAARPLRRAPPRLDHRLLHALRGASPDFRSTFRRGRGVRRHLRRPRRREAERAPDVLGVRDQAELLARAREHRERRRRQQQRDGERELRRQRAEEPALLRVLGHRLARRDAVCVFCFACAAAHPAAAQTADRRVHVGLQARGRSGAQLAELALRETREPRAVGAEEAVRVLHFWLVGCDIVDVVPRSGVASPGEPCAAAFFAAKAATAAPQNCARQLAARHNVESPVVSPQRLWTAVRSIAAAWRSREAAERAYELQTQVERCARPASDCHRPPSLRRRQKDARARAAPPPARRARWRKRSLLQGAPWRLDAAAGGRRRAAHPPHRGAAAQRGATRGVQSAEAHARARCDALQREVDRPRGQPRRGAEGAGRARRGGRRADDAEQVRETRAATWSRARRRRRERRRSDRCARRPTRSAASSISRTSSAAAPSASRSLPPSRAAKSSPQWRRSQSGGGRCCSCSSA